MKENENYINASDIIELIGKYHNDEDLGKNIRSYYNEQKEKHENHIKEMNPK